MSAPGPEPFAPAEPDLDDSGVDLTQIRAMLDLTPMERLSLVTDFVSALQAVRTRNEDRGTG